MPKQKEKKPAKDLTKDEAMERLFPKRVAKKLQEVAHERDKDEDFSDIEPSQK